MKKISIPLIVSLLAHFLMTGQTVLLDENFNSCALPAGWNVALDGNPTAVWYVGINQNDDYTGESIDGSCFLFIDDDATGDNTAAYVATVNSPWFDGSAFSTVALSMDVHYRDWVDVAESFKIFMEDAGGLHLLAEYGNGNQTGNHIYDFQTLKTDLSLVAQPSAQMRLVVIYDDAGGFNWWAGFDNVRVVGSGAGQNIVTATFNDCALPAGWETEVLTGDADWVFGISENNQANPKSMNGSCFALFDDDILGANEPFSATQLKTPWFDGTQFANYTLELDLLHRYYKESIGILVETDLGETHEVASFFETIGGNQFDKFAHLVLDLSPFRSQQMRVIFDYSDNQDFGWWTGIDNVKIWGQGQGHDLCDKALPLVLGSVCLAENNRTAVFSGPAATCSGKNVGGLWYRFDATFSGVARLQTKADFNDVVTIFQGDCQALGSPVCGNRDEHGFTGETTYFAVNQGVSYFIRVSGQDENFGVPRGNLCVSLSQVPGFPPKPANDKCANAQPISLDGNCLAGDNFFAETDGPAPSKNERSRHDIWFKFFTGPNPPTAADLVSNANFSDVLAVFSGACADLTEVVSSEHGQQLRLENLLPNTPYHVQVSGNFATVEGQVCMELKTVNQTPPTNDNCLTANVLTLDGACFSATNSGATFSGLQPGCAFNPTADVWFKFTAPAAGKVKINTGAEFPHVAAIWEGANCSSLELVFCVKNPLRCQGYFEVAPLVAGQVYWLQIASFETPGGQASGPFCLKILNGNTPSDYTPLGLLVEDFCTGQNMATLEITATGGTQPLDFQGNTNGEAVASGDDWLVVVTDQLNCILSASGIVDSCAEADCLLDLSLAATDVSCFGMADGTATPTVSGADGQPSFAWSFQNSTASSLQNLPAGSYTLTVNDAKGCIQTATVVVNEPPPFLISLVSATNPTVGNSNGSINIEVSGGNGGWIFSWQTPGGIMQTEDLTNVPAGNYSITLTDMKGCAASFNYVLEEVVSAGEAAAGIGLSISPNPTSGKAVILIQPVENEDVAWQIFDVNGRLILENGPQNQASKSWQIDLTGQPAGVFSLKIQAGNASISRRIVVVR